MYRVTIAAALLVMAVLSNADTFGHDWKYFGASGDPHTGSEWFYLPGETVRLPNGHIQVWTESISSTSMLNYVTAQAAQETPLKTAFQSKIASGYNPPVAVLLGFDAKLSEEAVLMELAVNMGQLTPQASGLMEIDCKGHLYRNTSETHYDNAGLVTSSHELHDEWSSIVPGTLVDTLSNLICK